MGWCFGFEFQITCWLLFSGVLWLLVGEVYYRFCCSCVGGCCFALLWLLMDWLCILLQVCLFILCVLAVGWWGYGLKLGYCVVVVTFGRGFVGICIRSGLGGIR